MCQTPQKVIRNIGSPNRLWVIPSIHADVERLMALHDAIYSRFELGDRILYLGNYTGYGETSLPTIEEIFLFRRLILSIQGVTPSDIIYLRGAQEDMMAQLMQLHYAPNPQETLLWMLGNGMGATLNGFGLSPHDAIMASREGILSLTRYLGKLQQCLRNIPGYYKFTHSQHRAVYTEHEGRFPLLFVHSGLDPVQPIEVQSETLTWNAEGFETMEDLYAPFDKVVRGYDPKHKGLNLNCIKATLDDGCGFGGQLTCASMQANGEINELLAA